MRPIKKHLVTLYRPSETLDDRGQRDASLDTVLVSGLPASIEFLSGNELQIARQLMATATHRIRFYQEPSWETKPKDYITWRGRVLEFGQVGIDTELEREVTCLAAEVI